MKHAILLLVIGASIAIGQTSSTSQTGESETVWKGLIPTTTTAVTTRDGFKIRAVVLTNSTASDITCQMQDRTTDCSGGACDLLPSSPSPLVVKAASIYAVPLFDIPADQGFTWSCSATGVTGRVVARRKYP